MANKIQDFCNYLYEKWEDMPPEERMSSERFIKEQRKKGVSFEAALQAFFRFAEEQEQEQEPREKMEKLVLPFPEEQWNDFAVPALQAVNFPAWRDEYVDPGVCDGTQWGMHIRQGENVRKIHGSNDFPEEYGVFRKFISDCLKLNQEKELGTFTTRIQARKRF